MFLLMMVILATQQHFLLETFSTAEDCQVERNRIGFEMAAAYPYDRDFVIACQLSSKHSS